jgi:phosphatidate cytidylyltransferase
VTTPDHANESHGQGGRAGNLTLRAASAAVLAPVTLAVTFADGWIFLALCALAAGIVLWEWTALASDRNDPRVLAPGWAALFTAMICLGFRLPAAAWAVSALGAILAGVLVAGRHGGTRTLVLGNGTSARWSGAGVLYAGVLLLAPALLRGDPEWGLTALLFLFANVWATDIFAYFCGRAVGGPLLWPTVSPRKTWSGAAGGLVGGVAASVAVAYASGIGRLGIVGVMALVLSVLAQAGDLFESAVKRRFGAKDASHLIPGHGGLMDRLDGFLVAALAALLIGMIRYGTAAPARGLLIW